MNNILCAVVWSTIQHYVSGIGTSQFNTHCYFVYLQFSILIFIHRKNKSDWPSARLVSLSTRCSSRTLSLEDFSTTFSFFQQFCLSVDCTENLSVATECVDRKLSDLGQHYTLLTRLLFAQNILLNIFLPMQLSGALNKEHSVEVTWVHRQFPSLVLSLAGARTK
jgi:hypothetical protein